MDSHPYLILTLRRTGGTSLTGFLARISDFPGIEHEPFNANRIWGETTQAYRKTRDTAALQAAIAEHVERRPNIKHCIEVVPMAVTRALIDACLERDYRIFVLTRRHEDRRLFSLFIAQATGAWGPKQAEKLYPQIIAGERIPEPVPLDAVAKRVHQDAAALGRTLSLLRSRQVDYEWLIYEELYENRETIEAHARHLAARLGVTVPADDPRLEGLASGRTRQGSEQIADYVPNVAALKEALARQVPR